MQQANSLEDLKREIDIATDALKSAPLSTLANIECRVADLQQRFITTPAATLDDLETRLTLIRDIVAGLGRPGYLLHLVEATLADVRTMQAGERA
jgi:hypothetical protein